MSAVGEGERVRQWSQLMSRSRCDGVRLQVSDEYWRLKGLHVDLLAGIYDGLIPQENTKWQADTLAAAGAITTYKALHFAHLDLTMSGSDELRTYVMSRLLIEHSASR